MEAGHRYCAVSLGGFAAVRAIRIRRQRRAAAFCSREWQEIASPPGSRSGVPVPLTSPALANVSAVAVGGDGNGAAGDTRKYRVHCKDMCCICSWPASCRGKPLGYKVDDTKLKRAGLDYWPYVVVKIHDSWDHFCDYFMKQEGDKRLLAFTKRGTQIHSDFSYRPGDWLVFGSETKGLPQQALEDCCKEGLGGGTVRIPMVETYVRCLNLSVSVGIALYEAARQLNYEQLHYQPELPQEARGLFPAEDIYA